MQIERINPPTLHRNPAFTQAIVLGGSARTVLIGGQNAIDKHGNVVGRGDLAAQTEKAIDNLFAAVEAAGGRPDHLVRLGIFVVAGQDLGPGFGTWLKRWENRGEPPLITVLQVAGLAHPDFLIEIEAMAVIPDVDSV